MRPEDGQRLLLVVQNTRRWAQENSRQPYAVAVALGRDLEHGDLYAELRIQSESLVEIPTEIQVQA